MFCFNCISLLLFCLNGCLGCFLLYFDLINRCDSLCCLCGLNCLLWNLGIFLSLMLSLDSLYLLTLCDLTLFTLSSLYFFSFYSLGSFSLNCLFSFCNFTFNLTRLLSTSQLNWRTMFFHKRIEYVFLKLLLVFKP